MKYIDYSFYRIYTFYKKNRDSTPIFMSCGVLSIAGLCLLLSISAFSEMLFKQRIIQNKLVVVMVVVLELALLFYRFKEKNRIDELHYKYHNEPVNQKVVKGLIIGGSILALIIWSLLYGILKHNFHYNI